MLLWVMKMTIQVVIVMNCSSLASWAPFCLIIILKCESKLGIKKQYSKIGHIQEVILNKLDFHPSHFYDSWMVFLISFMVATINLNTSLNQHSLP